MGIKEKLGVNGNNEIDSEILLPNKILPSLTVVAGLITGTFLSAKQSLLICLVIFLVLSVISRVHKNKIDRYDVMILYQICLAIVFALISLLVVGLRHILW